MPPIAIPIGGMMMSLTREVTTPPNAAPMITPTARSRTLPRIANSLNSLNTLLLLRIDQFLPLLFVVAETTGTKHLETVLREQVRGTRGSSTPVSKGDDQLILRNFAQSLL